MIEYDFCCFFGKEIEPTQSVLEVSTWLTTMERSKKSMSIGREDLDSRRVDFSGVTSGRRLPPVHPGEILRDEFLAPLALSVYRLAQEIKVPSKIE